MDPRVFRAVALFKYSLARSVQSTHNRFGYQKEGKPDVASAGGRGESV